LARFDVIVIGGGVAGAVAAKKAADGGRRVALVRAGGGASAHASGAFDVAGPPDPRKRREEGSPTDLDEALRALLRLGPSHPYHLVSGGDLATLRSLLEEATGDLFEALGEAGLPYRGSLDRNLWLATPGGRVKETAFAQEPIAAGDLAALARARVLAVTLGDRPPEEARAVAAALRRELDFRGYFGVREIAGVAVESLPEGAGAAPDEVRIAAALDDEEACARYVREAVVPAIAAAGGGRFTHALFPPVLGLREPAAVMRVFRRELGGLLPVETLALPPSVPGLRLEAAVGRVLAARGVTTIAGRAVEGEAAGGALRRLRVAGGGAAGADGSAEWHEGLAFVLAAGRFLGSGLRAGNAVREPLFGLPLAVPGTGRALDPYGPELRPEDVFRDRPFGRQPGATLGVACEPDLRPRGPDGGPVFENLFAAGTVLAGADTIAERSGLGVALTTGYVAGLNAAEAAQALAS